MHVVERSRWIAFPPATVYEVLTDETQFPKIVKRLGEFRVLSRDSANKGRVFTKLDLPGGKMIETEGEVEGITNESVRFSTHSPFPMNIIWRLRPEKGGTQVSYTVELDLPPVVAQLPKAIVKGYLTTEMDGDLQRLEAALKAK